MLMLCVPHVSLFGMQLMRRASAIDTWPYCHEAHSECVHSGVRVDLCQSDDDDASSSSYATALSICIGQPCVSKAIEAIYLIEYVNV